MAFQHDKKKLSKSILEMKVKTDIVKFSLYELIVFVFFFRSKLVKNNIEN